MDLSLGIAIKVLKDQFSTWLKDARAGLVGVSAAAAQTGDSLDAGLGKGLGAAGALKEGIQSISTQLDDVRRFAGAFAVIETALGSVKDIARIADAYKNMAGRLQLVAGAGEQLDAALADVRNTANAAGADIGATADLYATLARATGESAQAVNGLTQTIVQSYAVSGAGAAAAEGATLQLAQALASGKLRGDEFNSVMEQAPRLAQAMADGLGVTTGELRRMADEGKLTSDVVIEALKSQAGAIDAEFQILPQTIGRATQRMANEWTVFIGELDKTHGASDAVTTALNGVTENMQAIGAAALMAGEAVLAGFVARAGAGVVQYGKDLLAARAATTANAVASLQAGNAANWAALQAEKSAAAELSRAKAMQSATGAALAELEASRAVAAQDAIYGPHRAALERDVATARAANARATEALVLAERQLLVSQQAGIAAAGALATATATHAGLMATAWGKVQQAGHAVANAVRAIPTQWLVTIGILGYDVAIAAVKKVSEALAEMALQSDGTRERLAKQREEMIAQGADAAATAQDLAQYKDVAIQVAANVQRMGDAERARYQDSLEGARKYWEALYREAALAEETGRKSTVSKEEAGKHLAALSTGLKDVEAASQLTRAAFANLIDPQAAQQVADFTARVAELREKGEPAAQATAKALADMAKSLDVTSLASVRAYGEGLDELRSKGVISGEQVAAAWGDAVSKLDGAALQRFGITAKAAFGEGERGGRALADVLDAELRRAVTASGQDWEKLKSGIGKAAGDTIAIVDNLAAHYGDLRNNGIDAGAALSGALKKAVEAADTEEAIAAVIAVTEEMGKAGKLAGEGFSRALEYARKKADELTPGINSIEEAYKKLGITSQAALQKEAEDLKSALDLLRTHGASQADLTAAWAKYASAAIAANGGVASATIQAEAAMYGYEVVVDRAGKTTVRAMQEAAEATEQSADAASRAADEYERIAREAKAAAAAKREANRNAGYAIYDQYSFVRDLESYGLSNEEITSLLRRTNVTDPLDGAGLARQVLGNLGLSAGPGVSASAAIGLDYRKRPHRYAVDAAQDGGTPQPSTTYRVTIQLPSGKSGTVGTATADDARTLTDLLKQLQIDMARA